MKFPNSSIVLRHARHGPPLQVLELGEVPIPTVGRREVRVRMRMAPVHPSDLNRIEGTYGVLRPLPDIGGGEGLGIVEELGEEVSSIKKGQWVQIPRSAGSWREMWVGPASTLMILPEGLSETEAAMLTINPPSAWLMLTRFVDLQAGDWIIQNAANSAVGRLVIQLTRARGIHSINLVRRSELKTELEKLGADVVLTEDVILSKSVSEITGGKPVRLALNAVGGECAVNISKALVYGGTMVTYGAMSRRPFRVGGGALIFKDLRLRGFWASKILESMSPEEIQTMYGDLTTWIRQGKLKTAVDRIYPLSDFKNAIARAIEGKRFGKILFQMGS